MAQAPIGMILAAGYGTRLWPLTDNRPKPILEIAAKPMIYILIKMLEEAGIKDIIINLHHRPAQIRQALARFNFKSRIHLVYEKEILNTAGGIANAIRALDISKRKMVIVHGDIVTDLSIAPFLDTRSFASIICDQDRHIEGYEGGVGIDEHGRVVILGKFYQSLKKPQKSGFFTGIHILSEEAVMALRSCQQESLVAQMYPQWLKEGRDIRGVMLPLFYDDLGTPKRLFDANMAVLKAFPKTLFMRSFNDTGDIDAGDRVFVSKKAQIDKSARLIAPILIADGVEIHEGASIGPQAIIGERSVVGPFAKVSNSVVMSDTTIDKDENLDRTIVMDRIRVQIKD